jgi:hypothetical protein
MEIPSLIGKYEVIEFLGGSQSQMYRARDTVMDRPVVLKILSAEASSDAEFKARFLDEAREASVVESGEHEGRFYIVIRVRESPTPSILRVSLVTYAAVLFTTAIAIGAWLWMRKAPDIPIEPSPRGQGGALVSSMVLIPGDKPFYIDVAAVTGAEFCAVIHCGGAPTAPNLPAVNMTVAQARQYASYKGKRLPTALEWEKAARDSNPSYRTAGNVWELVEDPGARSVEALSIFAGVLRPPRPVPEGSSAKDVGFRCAKDL